MSLFFFNYSSPKSKDFFESHNQITALIYWNSINVQIRMKAKIKELVKNLIINILLTEIKIKMPWQYPLRSI